MISYNARKVLTHRILGTEFDRHLFYIHSTLRLQIFEPTHSRQSLASLMAYTGTGARLHIYDVGAHERKSAIHWSITRFKRSGPDRHRLVEFPTECGDGEPAAYVEGNPLRVLPLATVRTYLLSADLRNKNFNVRIKQAKNYRQDIHV